MRDIVGIIGLLVVSLASLTYSNPAEYQNAIGHSIYGDNNPFASDGSMTRYFKAYPAQKISELSNSGSNGNLPSSNDNDKSIGNISDLGNTNTVNDNSKSLNSNINTINGRLFVNGGEYEIFKGGDKVLNLPCGTFTGLKQWKQLEGEERRNAEEAIKNQINGIPMELAQTPNTDTNLPEALKKDDSQSSDKESPVESTMVKTENGSTDVVSGNVDMTGDSDSDMPKSESSKPKITIGHSDDDEHVNMGGIDSDGNNTGFGKISKVANSNVEKIEDVIDNDGKTSMNSEHENVKDKIETIPTADQRSEKEQASDKEISSHDEASGVDKSQAPEENKD